MVVLAYFSPEVVLPLTSVVAAAFGFIMMVGRAPFRLVARALRAAFIAWKKENRPKNPTGTHPDSRAR